MDKRERQIENYINSQLLSMSSQPVPDVWDRFQGFASVTWIIQYIHLDHCLYIFLFSLPYRLYWMEVNNTYGIFQGFHSHLLPFSLVLYFPVCPTFLTHFWIGMKGYSANVCGTWDNWLFVCDRLSTYHV